MEVAAVWDGGLDVAWAWSRLSERLARSSS